MRNGPALERNGRAQLLAGDMDEIDVAPDENLGQDSWIHIELFVSLQLQKFARYSQTLELSTDCPNLRLRRTYCV
jgi:hypothetical protein